MSLSWFLFFVIFLCSCQNEKKVGDKTLDIQSLSKQNVHREGEESNKGMDSAWISSLSLVERILLSKDLMTIGTQLSARAVYELIKEYPEIYSRNNEIKDYIDRNFFLVQKTDSTTFETSQDLYAPEFFSDTLSKRLGKDRKQLYIFQADTGDLRFHYSSSSEISNVYVSERKNMVALFFYNNSIQLFELDKKNPSIYPLGSMGKQVLPIAGKNVLDCELTYDGSLLVIHYTDKTIEYISTKNPEERKLMDVQGDLIQLAKDTNWTLIIEKNSDEAKITLYDIKKSMAFQEFTISEDIQSFTATRSLNSLVVITKSKNFIIYDLATGDLKTSIRLNESPKSIQFNPDGTKLLLTFPKKEADKQQYFQDKYLRHNNNIILRTDDEQSVYVSEENFGYYLSKRKSWIFDLRSNSFDQLPPGLIDSYIDPKGNLHYLTINYSMKREDYDYYDEKEYYLQGKYQYFIKNMQTGKITEIDDYDFGSLNYFHKGVWIYFDNRQWRYRPLISEEYDYKVDISVVQENKSFLYVSSTTPQKRSSKSRFYIINKTNTKTVEVPTINTTKQTNHQLASNGNLYFTNKEKCGVFLYKEQSFTDLDCSWIHYFSNNQFMIGKIGFPIIEIRDGNDGSSLYRIEATSKNVYPQLIIANNTHNLYSLWFDDNLFIWDVQASKIQAYSKNSKQKYLLKDWKENGFPIGALLKPRVVVNHRAKREDYYLPNPSLFDEKTDIFTVKKYLNQSFDSERDYPQYKYDIGNVEERSIVLFSYDMSGNWVRIHKQNSVFDVHLKTGHSILTKNLDYSYVHSNYFLSQDINDNQTSLQQLFDFEHRNNSSYYSYRASERESAYIKTFDKSFWSSRQKISDSLGGQTTHRYCPNTLWQVQMNLEETDHLSAFVTNEHIEKYCNISNISE